MSELLITVDNGPDERPRNMATHFVIVLLKLLLNLDRVKTVAYAEGDLKRHSVERYHHAENRALSQHGRIDSHGIHDKEVSKEGTFDESKFRENMEYAAKDAVHRISGVPYGRDKFLAYTAPPEDEWVVQKDIIDKMHHFLKRDTSEHRREFNFVIRPQGPVWERVCEMYDLHPGRVFSACRIFNEMTDPHTWICHYAFTSYRSDESWRGQPCDRFELSPVLDISQLPEYHYLTYQQACQLRQYYSDENLEQPLWLKAPDFYLPSKNIQRVTEEDPNFITNVDKLKSLSEMIGVAAADIVEYVRDKEEKAEHAAGRKEALKEFENDIGRLTCAEIRRRLKQFGVAIAPEQNRKVDLLLLLQAHLSKLNIQRSDFMKDYLSDDDSTP